MRLAPTWPVWVVPALALMRLLAGRNVGAASPDGAPELAHKGKCLLFFISSASTAVAVSCRGWCAIAPSWLVIERRENDDFSRHVRRRQRCRAADVVRMGPDEPYLKAKVVGWGFPKPLVPHFVYLVV